MARRDKKVGDYRHEDARRLNNPTAALAREDVAPVPRRPLRFDPHRPPELMWAGKDEEGDEVMVEAPSIHVHERLSTEAILKAAQRENAQITLFADPGLDRAQQIEFYEHEMGWANRLILGDSLIVMTSLLERERLAEGVQAIYVDPPYGIGFRSNFQPRITDRNPTEGKDESISREPEAIEAYRDTWQLGVHSYLSYVRARLVACRDLLAPTGCLFFQIGSDNVHRVRTVLDEIFGPENSITPISMQKSGSATSALLPEVLDYILWYAKDKEQFRSRFRPLYEPFDLRELDTRNYRFVEEHDGQRRHMTPEERENPVSLAAGLRPFRLVTATSQNPSKTRSGPYVYQGETYWPDKDKGRRRQWSVSVPEGLDRLGELNRLDGSGGTLQFIRYLDDFPVQLLKNVWLDTGRSGFGEEQRYVVQTNSKAIERCLLMATDPGDLVLDPTCGSGTTAWCAEKHGRRWITIDTSRVALAVARERLLTARFSYYELLDEARGVDAGLKYEAVVRTQPSDLAEGRPGTEVPLRNRPRVDQAKVRVAGPFTVEALSRYADNPFNGGTERISDGAGADHVAALLDALRSMGIPRRGGAAMAVQAVQPISGSPALHGEGTYLDAYGAEQLFAVSLGPRHGPITMRQIDDALKESPGYDLIVFAGFAATAEAQDYLAPGRRGRINVALLEANADLLLGDLLKNTKASQTFRLFAAPETVALRDKDGTVHVELLGMDSFDAATGEVVSRNQDEIAAWFLDHDYDGAVFHVNQAFFTRSDAWEALGRALKATIDAGVVETMHSFTSLPFEPGPSRTAAVRVVDDAGQTSEAIIDLGA